MGFRVWWVAFAALAACGEDDEPSGLCDAAEIQAALSAAEPGATVTVGECRVSGSFAVPAGVTLAGLGVEKSVIVGPAADVAIDLASGDDAAVVRDLAVESEVVGIRIRGAGAATIERVDVEAARGLGLAADGAESLELTSVTLRGPMTASEAEGVNSEPEPTETAIMGVVLLDVAEARLHDVQISGFAGWGLFAADSETTWDGGLVATNLLFGIHVQSGRATLRNVEVMETLQGGLLFPSMAVFGTFGAVVDSSALEIHDNEAFGLLSFGSSGAHESLVVQGSGDAGVWLQGANDVSLAGAQIVDNHLAGIMVLESSGITLQGVDVERTKLLTTVIDLQAGVLVGDGLQLVSSTNAIRLADSSFTANARIGLFIDLGAGDMSGLRLERLAVSAEGDAFGAVAQNGTVEDGWDSAVDRNAEAQQNDATFDGSPLPVPEEVTPPDAVDKEAVRGVMGPNN